MRSRRERVVLPRRTRTAAAAATLATTLAMIAACGGSDASADGGAGSARTARGDTIAAPGAATVAASSQGSQQAVFRSGAISIHDVVAPAPVPAGDSAPPIAVYLFAMNDGAEADTLVAIEVAGARATLHDQTSRGPGMEVMRAIDVAPVPAGTAVRFVPGGRHVMIEGLARPVAAGDALPMTLVFRRAGRIDVRARVVSYADLDGVIAAGADEHAGH